MVNQTCFQLGSAPSVIRELFAYGLQQSALVGPENVYDYSLGNPSIPAPNKVHEAIYDILSQVDSIKIHGYSMAAGFDGTRQAIADNLNRRFGLNIKPSELFLTCGAAPALIAIIKALAATPESEIIAVAPFFPEKSGACPALLTLISVISLRKSPSPVPGWQSTGRRT